MRLTVGGPSPYEINRTLEKWGHKEVRSACKEKKEKKGENVGEEKSSPSV